MLLTSPFYLVGAGLARPSFRSPQMLVNQFQQLVVHRCRFFGLAAADRLHGAMLQMILHQIAPHAAQGLLYRRDLHQNVRNSGLPPPSSAGPGPAPRFASAGSDSPPSIPYPLPPPCAPAFPSLYTPQGYLYPQGLFVVKRHEFSDAHKKQIPRAAKSAAE